MSDRTAPIELSAGAVDPRSAIAPTLASTLPLRDVYPRRVRRPAIPSVRAHGHLVAGSRRGDPRLRNGERGCGGFRRARWFPSTVRGPAVAEFRETCLHSERPRCGLLSYLTNLFSNCIVSERCPLPSPCSSNPMTCAWRCRRCAGHCSNDCVPPPRQPPSSRPSSRSVVSASITTCVPSREPA